MDAKGSKRRRKRNRLIDGEGSRLSQATCRAPWQEITSLRTLVVVELRRGLARLAVAQGRRHPRPESLPGSPPRIRRWPIQMKRSSFVRRQVEAPGLLPAPPTAKSRSRLEFTGMAHRWKMEKVCGFSGHSVNLGRLDSSVGVLKIVTPSTLVPQIYFCTRADHDFG